MSAPHSPEFDSGGECIAAVDWLGNRFSVGETVLYCIGAGRGQMMAYGKVLKIKHEKHRSETWRDPWLPEHQDIAVDRLAWVYYPRREQVVKKQWLDVREWEEITVQVLTTKTSGHWANKQRTRPAWVNPMNITALPVRVAEGEDDVQH